jgi:hypothetical protein
LPVNFIILKGSGKISTKYLLIAACNISSAAYAAPPEDEQVMLKTFTDP